MIEEPPGTKRVPPEGQEDDAMAASPSTTIPAPATSCATGGASGLNSMEEDEPGGEGATSAVPLNGNTAGSHEITCSTEGKEGWSTIF